MQIKRFEAKNMTEALKMIKSEFGSQAVILSAKTIKKNSGIFGAIRNTGVEITAASDRYRSLDFKELPVSPNEEDLNRQKNRNTFPIEQNVTSLDRVLKKDNPTVAPGIEADQNIQTESPLITKLRLNLEEQGVFDHTVKDIVKNVSRATQHQNSIRMEEVKNIFNRIISDRITVAKTIEGVDDQPLIAAFVGPTGVGKTTTIAKLSAKSALEQKKSIALVSMDYQRVGATVTLEKYAGIIGLPYTTVSSENELRQAIQNFQSHRYIFVDTPGLAMGDTEEIARLAGQLTSIAPNEVHLLLSAVTKDQDMTRLCRAYAPCKVNRLIFTKIDETFWVGNLLNIVEKNNIPLAYLTNGQSIPENIIDARADIIADLLFNVVNSHNHSGKGSDLTESVPEDAQTTLLPDGDYYVANKNSDIFHHRNCKSVGRINMSNIIVFQNNFDAQEKHFKPCRMCCIEQIRNDRLMQKFKHKVAVGR